jgi:glycosyltransferase involved in cell wall biosynthesis
MKVSIITATYNSEFAISDCVQSINKQSYSDIEHIIIDGKSFDNTLDIIRGQPNRVTKIISETDRGIYDAMNKGILTSNGEIVGILNSDDVYFNDNVITEIVNLFEKNPQLDIVYGNIVYVDKRDLNKIVRVWNSKSYYDLFFENGNVPPHPSVFVRKIVYQKMGLFNLDLHLASDYEFLLRIFKSLSFNSYFLPKTIVKMRLGGATNKNLFNIIKGNYEIYLSWKLNNYDFPLLLMPLRIIKRVKQFFK